nr:immunoglobulin heavy chain junction region [Mus musculus]MBK4183679.1 immunoglobulin heavy chain junction region [Mus musculus]MBK4183680.1 immunoglobulin heavy chain junction region [Mus musculus]MBK4196658.1 immunoglobulin heavy chain junction region [Mus musculus]
CARRWLRGAMDYW